MPPRVYTRRDPLAWEADGATRRASGDGWTAELTYLTVRDRAGGVDWSVSGARPGGAKEWASGHASSGAAAKGDVCDWLEARRLVEFDPDA